MTSLGLVTAVVPALAAGAVRFLGATARLSVAGVEAVQPLWRTRRPLIYVAWHGRTLMMPWTNAWLRRTHGVRAPRVLTSWSRDGEVVARYLGRFGLGVARGSSSRGGSAALKTLLATLAAGQDVVVVPDGPRGPRCRLQPGVVMLAARSGAPVVPLAFAAHPARRLPTWDEFLIPLPFARCALVFGAPAGVATGTDREAARRDLEHRLLAATVAADALVAS